MLSIVHDNKIGDKFPIPAVVLLISVGSSSGRILHV